MKSHALASALLIACATPLAQAGPLDERAATAHLEAIAAGDVDALMQAYGDDPFVEWVGGAIDGRYRGKEAIRAAWVKFMANNDHQPRTVVRSAWVQNANPTGVTLVANAEFTGKAKVRIREVLVYRDGKLVTEIWQIDPKAELAP